MKTGLMIVLSMWGLAGTALAADDLFDPREAMDMVKLAHSGALEDTPTQFDPREAQEQIGFLEGQTWQSQPSDVYDPRLAILQAQRVYWYQRPAEDAPPEIAFAMPLVAYANGYVPPMPVAVYPIYQPPLSPIMLPAVRQPEPPVSVATVVAPPPVAAKPPKKPILTAAIVASGVVRPRSKPAAAPQPEPATTTAARLAAERHLAELARQTRRARNDMLLWLGILIAFCVTTGSISVYLLKKEGRT